jgi:hypothetical protein
MTRPAHLNDNEFYIDDRGTNAFLFSEDDKGVVFDICYYIESKDTCYREAGITAGSNTTGDYASNNAAIDTGRVTVTGESVFLSNVTGPLAYTAGTPEHGEYSRTISTDGTVVLLFHMDDAHYTGRLEIPTGTTSEEPPAGVVLGANYLSIAKKQDCAWLYDENGVLAPLVGVLAGATVQFKRCGSLACRTATPYIAPYGEETFTAVDAGDYLYYPSQGIGWIKTTKVAAVGAATPNICLRF